MRASTAVHVAKIGCTEADHAPAGSDEPAITLVVPADLQSLEVVRAFVLHDQPRVRPCQVHPPQELSRLQDDELGDRRREPARAHATRTHDSGGL